MASDTSSPCARLGVLAGQVISNAGRKTEETAYESQSLGSRVSRGCEGYEETLHRNWCGNVRFGGVPVVPASLGELQQAVQNGKAPIRVVGRGHSFTPVAECTGGTLLCLAHLNHVLDFEPPTDDRIGSITVEGGTTYTEIAQFLGRRGALRNLPSCPQFTAAGAIATGTHGSGVQIQNLAADVAMIEFIKADGSLVSYSRHDRPEHLEGCRVHLGCLGVVSRLTLDVVQFYEVETHCYIDVTLDSVIDNLPALWQSCDSLSFWTSGFGHGPGAGTGWLMFRHFAPHWNPSLAAPAHNREELLGGATLMETSINRYCTNVDKPAKFHPTGRGPWHDRLSLTLDEAHETSMTVVDLQAEFFVPLEHAQAAIRAVWDTAKQWTFSSPWGHTGEPIKGLVDAMEFRQVKGDKAWLSPQSVDSLGIHVSFNGDPASRDEVLQVLPSLERALKPFRARAHWGKLATLTCAPSRIDELFGERLQQFRALCKEHDPTGKFRNSYIQNMLFSNESD